MRITFSLAVASGLLIGLSSSVWTVPRLAQSQETKPGKPAAADTDQDDLAASAQAFETAFNKGDAKSIASQFTETAEVVDEDGSVVKGRGAIEARFTELFKAWPKARISVELTSLRKLSPDVAVEDGFSQTELDPESPGSRSPYTLVHLKRGGKWLIASIRDFPEEKELTAHDHLQPLEWLVGDWVDQSTDAKVETSCKWADDGNFLIQEFVIKLRGGQESRGTQRIGWDPLRKTIRAWAFDHSGGFGESAWTLVDGSWVIKAEGVTPDGRVASVTRVLTQKGIDHFQLDSTQRLVGQELLPDSSVRVVRRPPAPQ
jgi:uncharacterized protein (TIGR02246 family)